ncbi:Pyruvate-flavodoxin oxidoreductase 5 [Spironucleus salmonicida]|uniref:Pyruvate-flavodoxin oxidoreductase 5 n=1 Tax=Spironucleus salmonicida TaxID=348837 RepID=K7R1I2_9EUKA|nr:pyruvate-flavodoxin oxidoreductase 5 [Spironucleus salmonicida]KAH0575054.1 Pyruvate-flavodoxin oxidoreductase 5 [Spironucleus salmonicida]|eukprot:EST48995.1 Pyruvate-flavodoxin oxidoreductase 5 [Spironucleus salmonicida]
MITANTVTSQIASKLAQTLFVYPITPSTAATKTASILAPEKTFQTSSELASIAGVHGAGHYKLPSATFTASQGLLLMLPSILKMTGERVPGVIHVAARSLATHSLSIQGDHQDIAQLQNSGAIIISSKDAKSCEIDALASYLISAKLQQPVIHFYDGFITSDELVNLKSSKIDFEGIYAHFLTKFNISGKLESKNVGMIAGSNIHFQMTEAQTFEARDYQNEIQKVYDFLEDKIGVKLGFFEGCEKTNKNKIEHLVVSTGSSVDSVKFAVKQHPDVDYLDIKLFRPFQHQKLAKILQQYRNLKTVTILDRYREITSPDTEILYLDMLKTKEIHPSNYKILAGVYGLSGKDFSYKDVDLIIQNAKTSTLKNFTVGINDDLNFTSLNQYFQADTKKYSNPGLALNVFSIASEGLISAVQTFSQSLSDDFPFIAQRAHYDAKKAGGNNRTEVRFGSEYIPTGFEGVVAVSNLTLFDRNSQEIDQKIQEDGFVIVNGPQDLVKNAFKSTKNCKVYCVDMQDLDFKVKSNFHFLFSIALCMEKEGKLTFNQTNQIKQNLKLQLTNISSKKHIKNIDQQLQFFDKLTQKISYFDYQKPTVQPQNLQQFQPQNYKISDETPTSYFKNMRNGFKHATNRENKLNFATAIPIWDDKKCIQCGKCVAACPHACIEGYLLTETEFMNFEKLAKTKISRQKIGQYYYIIQSAPRDCTGCTICEQVCPTKALDMKRNVAETNLHESTLFEFVNNIQQKTEYKERVPKTKTFTEKSLQFIESNLKYHSACAGCGETGYINLLAKINDKLPGLKMGIIQGTGCPLAYLGDVNDQPFKQQIFWNNSLFEDTAEVAIGLAAATRIRGEKTPIWSIQGDGSAYDIDFAGIDALARSSENVNCLVLDTHGYSNTGGQKSASSPPQAKMELGHNLVQKNLVLMMMHYKNAFLATISNNDVVRSARVLRAAQEFPGPSLVIAYAPCISHGVSGFNSVKQEKLAVESGLFPLVQFDPRKQRGERLVLESTKKISIADMGERRFDGADFEALDGLLRENEEDIRGLCKVM